MTTQTETIDCFMNPEPIRYTVIHPLHDVPEAKCNIDDLGPLKLTPGCRTALVAVRFYLVAIMLMGVYRVVTLIGAIKH